MNRDRCWSDPLDDLAASFDYNQSMLASAARSRIDRVAWYANDARTERLIEAAQVAASAIRLGVGMMSVFAMIDKVLGPYGR